MRGYTQFTQEERYQIYILKKAEYKQTEIAEPIQGVIETLPRPLQVSISISPQGPTFGEFPPQLLRFRENLAALVQTDRNAANN